MKPGLQSKRQQSEPPLNRNVFPPTPPPESEKSSTSVSSQMSRAASVRNGPKPMPAKLSIERARPQERYEIRDELRQQPQQRIGTTRTASEPRGPPARQYGQRSNSRGPPRRRTSDVTQEDEYPGELCDMYRTSRGARSTGKPRMPRYIEEEEEYASDYDDGSFDENEFEMVPSRPPPRSRATSMSGRAQSRRPDIRKIRVKVYANDVRYIMIGPAIEFPEFVDRIREKLGLHNCFKIKVKDEDMPDGDKITMGDQDDLEMIVMSVKAEARRERLDMGKLEVSFSFSYNSSRLVSLEASWLTPSSGLDRRGLSNEIMTCRNLLGYLQPYASYISERSWYHIDGVISHHRKTAAVTSCLRSPGPLNL